MDEVCLTLDTDPPTGPVGYAFGAASSYAL